MNKKYVICRIEDNRDYNEFYYVSHKEWQYWSIQSAIFFDIIELAESHLEYLYKSLNYWAVVNDIWLLYYKIEEIYTIPSPSDRWI